MHTAGFMRHPFIKALLLNIVAWLFFLLLVLIFYFVWLRDYQMNWGATAEDVSRHMVGDELIDDPELNATRAVEVNATPEQIWPWIVQMGYSRGGFYGFDQLDNGGKPSADRIIPECQNLKVGDPIPSGESKGKLFHIMEVAEMAPDTAMLWVFVATPWKGATWSWGLYPIDEEHTRLVSRLRHKYDFSSLEGKVVWTMVDAIEIMMMRTTLLGIRLRAEQR